MCYWLSHCLTAVIARVAIRNKIVELATSKDTSVDWKRNYYFDSLLQIKIWTKQNSTLILKIFLSIILSAKKREPNPEWNSSIQLEMVKNWWCVRIPRLEFPKYFQYIWDCYVLQCSWPFSVVSIEEATIILRSSSDVWPSHEFCLVSRLLIYRHFLLFLYPPLQ